MTSDYIKMCVANYFRFARQCPVVTLEYHHYRDGGVQSDVLVMTKDKRLIEIEVKVTLSDFKADIRKPIWSRRNVSKKFWPWKFYYAVPADLVAKVEPLLYAGCGLVGVAGGYEQSPVPQQAVTVAVTAPKHKDCELVSEKRYARIIAAQSSTLCCALRKNDRRVNGRTI